MFNVPCTADQLAQTGSGLRVLQPQQGRRPGKNGAALVHQSPAPVHEPLNAARLHKI